MNGRALVAWNLHRVRVKRGLSQERLAYDAEVDRSYVGSPERQEENPTVDVLERLAKTLRAPLSGLFRNPRKGVLPPSPLRSGRRPSRKAWALTYAHSPLVNRAVQVITY